MTVPSQLMRSIVEQTQDLVAAVDDGLRLLTFNPAYAEEFQRLYGHKPAVGDDLRNLVGHLPQDALVEGWSRALAGERFSVSQKMGDPALGQEEYAFSYGPLSVDGVLSAFMIARKVTAQSRREAELLQRNSSLEAIVEQQSMELEQVNFLLEEQRLRLSAALSVSDVGTFRHDVRHQLGYWDERLQHYFGVELENRPRPLDEFLTIVHPNDRAGVRANMEQAGKQLGPSFGSFRVVLKNSEVRWLQFRGQIFAGSDGQPAEMIGACADVTNLKQAEYELKVRERQIRELADHMPVIVWSQRQDFSLEYVNLRWRKYTGLKLEDTRNEGWRQVVHPDDLPRADAALAAAIETSGLLEVECRLHRACDGGYRWHLVRCLPVLDDQGQPMRWYGTAVDIEERVQAQQKWGQVRADLQRANDELAQSLARLEGVIGSMSEGVVLLGPDGTVLSVNAAARHVYGVPMDADLHLPHSETVARVDLRGVDGNLLPPEEWPSTRALNGEVVKGQEFLLRRQVNGEQWIGSYNAAPVYDKSGRLISAVVTVRDVTERRSHEQALQAAVQARDRFLSIASHELRTPLTTLTMQLQMARRRVDLDKGMMPGPTELATIFDSANRQTGRLAKLVDDLLDVSRSDLDQLAFHYQTTDLSQIVAETCAQFAIALEHAGCALECSLEPSVQGEWDGARLEQVVGNLLSNAIKYAAGKQIQVTLRQDSGNAILTVRDHGSGILQDHREEIFERFARFASDDGITGLGLGLYLTHQIVLAHGGTIELVPVEGPGACFQVTLPLQPTLAKVDNS